MTKFPIVEVKHAQVSGLPTVCDAAGLSLWRPTGCHAEALAPNRRITCSNAHLVASYSDHHTCAADNAGQGSISNVADADKCR